MSQDFNTISNRPRRTARSQRNRPTLVTPGSEQQEQPIQDVPAAAEPVAVVEPPPTLKRRLPNFFSTVGKSEQEATPNESDVAKARMARATRGKTPAQTKKSVAETPIAKATPSKSATAAARPAAQRPPSLFKPRYILGMVIYLVAANFLGAFERNALVSIGAERTLTKLNLFGLPLTVTTSGLAFIATLIIILVALAKLDLLPTSINAMTGGTPPPKKRPPASRAVPMGRRASGAHPRRCARACRAQMTTCTARTAAISAARRNANNRNCEWLVGERRAAPPPTTHNFYGNLNKNSCRSNIRT